MLAGSVCLVSCGPAQSPSDRFVLAVQSPAYGPVAPKVEAASRPTDQFGRWLVVIAARHTVIAAGRVSWLEAAVLALSAPLLEAMACAQN